MRLLLKSFQRVFVLALLGCGSSAEVRTETYYMIGDGGSTKWNITGASRALALEPASPWVNVSFLD